jgi:hypothetical protein
MTQVYDILNKIKDRLRDNPNVFSVTFGDISDVDLNKTTIFPLTHLVINNVEFVDSVINFEIDMLSMDILDISKKESEFDEFYGNDNLIDIYNTQLQVVNDIIQQFRRGGLFADNYQLLENPIANPFKDRYENILAGWEVGIRVSVSNDISIC